MALYGSSSIGPDIPTETSFGLDPWGRPSDMRYTTKSRLSHLEPIFLRPCGLRIQKGVSLTFQALFLVIASFGGLCWVMLGLLIREKWLLSTNKRAIVCFLSRKTLEPKSRKGREREREKTKTYHSVIVTSRTASCSPAEMFPSSMTGVIAATCRNYTSTIQGGWEISLAHWMMWDSSQLRVVFVCQCKDEKGQRWAQHWEICSVRQMFVLEVLIFRLLFFSTRRIHFLSLFIWLLSSNDLKWIGLLMSAVDYPIPMTMFIHIHQPGVHEFCPASLFLFDPIFVCVFFIQSNSIQHRTVILL